MSTAQSNAPLEQRAQGNRLVYKHLIALEALESLRSETLLEFLRPYEEWCAGIGVQLDAALDRKAISRLHHHLWSQDTMRPAELELALVDLGDMAGFWGWEATVHAAIEEWREGKLEPATSPVELAFREYLVRKHELFGGLAERVHGREIQRLVEFYATQDAPLEGHRSAPLLRRFEAELGRWLEARGRTSYCRIGVDESSTEIQFRVVRGMIPRSQQTIVDQTKLERIEFVPARPDLIVFDKRTRMLAVNAQLVTEHDFYRRLVGRVYFGDEEHFRVHEVYSGEPLLRDGARALSAEGFPAIRSIALREIRVETADRVRASLSGEDVKDHLEAFFGDGLFVAADVRFVKLAIFLRQRTRPTLVEIAAPNRCKLDRRIGEDLVRELLLARGFLRLPTNEPEGDTVSLAA
ncbi:MAG: hypothetical protein K8H88_16695 [Sandaracinaceae bacterium]|nr:hypothetical protein [Sandaracinaceae bacterium]